MSTPKDEDGREKYATEDEVRALLPEALAKPIVLERETSLPFHLLSPDEFEVITWLLVRREQPDKRVVLFGKTKDRGRDIVIVDDNHIQQCKRYGDRVGVGTVRAELAKLCVHTHAKAIESPSVVTFVVAEDLTSPAIDLLSDQNLWRNEANQALEDFLSAAPGEPLRLFAQDWWPDLRHETGAGLSDRLRMFPDLIDEFFTAKKVVVGDLAEVQPALNNLEVGQNDIREKLELLLASTVTDDAPSGMQSFLQHAEANNPGCVVKATSTSEGTVYEIGTDGDAKVEFGTLSFPATDAGKRGESKFLRQLDFGHDLELESGEFIWESKLQAPLPSGQQEGRLHIRNKPPPMSLLVRLDAMEGSEVVTSVRVAQLRVIRAGRREVELEIGGERFAGSLRLTLTIPRSTHGSITLSWNLVGHDVASAIATVEWASALVNGACLTIWSLVDDALFLRTSSLDIPITPEEVEGTLRGLRNLAAINDVFDLDLRYPEIVDDQTGRLISLIGAAVQHGSFAEPIRTMMVLDLPAQRADELVMAWRSGDPFTLTLDAWVEHELLGASIELGEAKLHVVDAAPARGLEELESQLASVGSDEVVRVALTGSQLVYEFARYLDTSQS